MKRGVQVSLSLAAKRRNCMDASVCCSRGLWFAECSWEGCAWNPCGASTSFLPFPPLLAVYRHGVCCPVCGWEEFTGASGGASAAVDEQLLGHPPDPDAPERAVGAGAVDVRAVHPAGSGADGIATVSRWRYWLRTLKAFQQPGVLMHLVKRRTMSPTGACTPSNLMCSKSLNDVPPALPHLKSRTVLAESKRSW